MARETKTASKVIKEIRSYEKTKVINIAGSQFQESGLPDCLILSNGIYVFVEFKGPETVIEPIQTRQRTLIEEAGGKSFFVRFDGPKEWSIDDLCSIKFAKFADGVKLLYDTLISLAKGGEVVFTPSSSTIRN